MLVLGLDPGTRIVGYGLVESLGSRLRLVAAGVLRPPPKDPIERRLAKIAEELSAVLKKHPPGVAAIEDAFVRDDPRAALMIGQGRGALLAVLGAHRIPVRSYPPASVKRAVAGNGRASKEQVARMVAAILGATAPPGPLDSTDALAVAIAHSLGASTRLLIGQRLLEADRAKASVRRDAYGPARP